MMMAANFPPLFPAERQEKIAAFVASRGKIRLDELASVFEVSQPTLRKDLTVLEQQGLLKRTHGGALRYSCARRARSHDAVRSERRSQASDRSRLL